MEREMKALLARMIAPGSRMAVVWTSDGKPRGDVVRRTGMPETPRSERTVALEVDPAAFLVAYRTTAADSGWPGARDGLETEAPRCGS